MRVGVWANTENFEKKFYRQCELGCGPQQRNGFPISTDNASWRGPNIEADGKSAYNNASWGGTTIKKYFSIEISISYA